ncbi:hypothetical protein ACFVAV_10510 [Nocardia sp. NPDC057663]|uniref:hypothetical protein n=1 Tax=Nocardia sp. NPDC057663 TaxID=3346201 RepID=UPI0036700EAA
MNEPDPSACQTNTVRTGPLGPSPSIESASAQGEGSRELAELLESLEDLGLIHSDPLPQRDPGRYLAGFGPAPTDYIGAPVPQLSRVAAAVREWASQPSRCRDESSPGTGDHDDRFDEPLPRAAASVLLPPWLAITTTAPQQHSMLARLYRLTRNPRAGRIARA